MIVQLMGTPIASVLVPVPQTDLIRGRIRILSSKRTKGPPGQ